MVIKLCKSGDLECGTSKAKPIDYIAIVVCSLLIVFGYSQGLPYMFDTIKMWQEYPSKMSAPDLKMEGEDTLSVDTMAVNNQEDIAESDGPDESVTTTNVDSMMTNMLGYVCGMQNQKIWKIKAAVNCV